ncbi:MAG: hypothetical protein HY902_12845 [Deltaproteobacteria bacterium]|nr:hypothetical protein [Deltaproteobacteria bacterium]
MSNIRPIQVQVVGLHPEFNQLLVIRVELEPQPSPLWIRLFSDFRQDGPTLAGFAPVIRDGVVEIHPSDEQLETFLLALERRIRHVNVDHAATIGRADPVRPVRRRPTSEFLADGFSVDVRDRIVKAHKAAERVSGMFQAQQWEPLEVTNLDRPPTRDTLLDIEPPQVPRGRKPRPANPEVASE